MRKFLLDALLAIVIVVAANELLLPGILDLVIGVTVRIVRGITEVITGLASFLIVNYGRAIIFLMILWLVWRRFK